MEQAFDFQTFFDALTKKVPGYVYAVLYEDGLVKIGSTSKPAQRFYTLQNSYREKPMRIDRVFVSGVCNDSRGAERRAQNGLKPVYNRETYKISFGSAVHRVIKATGTQGYTLTNSREETVERYKNLNMGFEGVERAMRKLLEMLPKQAQTADTNGL